jgi:hypothetical protein
MPACFPSVRPSAKLFCAAVYSVYIVGLMQEVTKPKFRRMREHCKASICGLLISEIAGSNPAEDMAVLLLCL